MCQQHTYECCPVCKAELGGGYVLQENKLLLELLLQFVPDYSQQHLYVKRITSYNNSERYSTIRDELSRIALAAPLFKDVVDYMVKHDVTKDELMYIIERSDTLFLINIESEPVLYSIVSMTYTELSPILTRYKQALLEDPVTLLHIVTSSNGDKDSEGYEDGIFGFLFKSGYTKFCGQYKNTHVCNEARMDNAALMSIDCTKVPLFTNLPASLTWD